MRECARLKEAKLGSHHPAIKDAQTWLKYWEDELADGGSSADDPERREESRGSAHFDDDEPEIPQPAEDDNEVINTSKDCDTAEDARPRKRQRRECASK